MHKIRESYFILFLIFLSSIPVKAQMKIVQVDRAHLYGTRISENDTLDLPFWDDFSTYEGIPDPAKWINSEGVYVNRTQAINPPTLGVATLDGATGNGGIYNPDPFKPGPADSLTSKIIDLSTIKPSEINTVFLSFFWEYDGFVEKPDSEDSLRLQFKDSEGVWNTIDVFTDKDFIAADTFVQVIYNVVPVYFHSGFQFRFQIFGKLNGPYDAWHIDYVFLNKNRKINDKTYFDRAVSRRPSYLFKDYSAIPIDHYFNSPEKFDIPSSIDVYNLDAIFQPISYSAIVVDQFDPEQVIDVLNTNTELNPILQGQERRTIRASLLDNSKLDSNLDSLYLQIRFYLSTGDTIQSNGIDFRVNDTTYSNFTLHDYYAYDDGSAEFGIGIEQKSGKVACMYVLEKRDVLTQVDVHFPNIGRNQAGTPFDLLIWKKLSNAQADVIYRRENLTIDAITSFNEFQSIRLPELQVQDTIYIGWESLTNEMMVMGLDKENDMGNRLYYNVDGTWKQNSDISGSPMIRPHFGTGEGGIIGIDEDMVTEPVKIYPNPASSQLIIEGNFKSGTLYDLQGRVLKHIEPYEYILPTVVPVHDFRPGLYILEITCQEKRQVEKIWIVH